MRLAALVLVALVLTVAPADAGTVRHVHASSRFDRSPEALHAQVERLTQRAGVATWTEVDAPARARALRVPGWRVFGAESAVSWRLERWRLVHAQRDRITPETWAVSVILEDRGTGERLAVSVVHMPAHVEYGDGFRFNRQADVWRAAVAGQRRLNRALGDRWRPSARLVAGDWNVDLRRPSWRHRMARAFPRLRVTWHHPLPAGGTHRGGRLIDATFSTARGRAHLARDDTSSDHRPYRDRLEW